MQTRQVYQEAVAELRQLERRISALHKILDGLAEYDPDLRSVAAPTQERPANDQPRRGTVRSSSPTRGPVLALLTEHTGLYLTTTEIAQSLEQSDWQTDGMRPEDAVRKALHRLHKEGKVDRQRVDGRSYRYGVPATAQPVGAHPLDTSAPVAAGAEGDVPTSGLGGDAYGPPDHDHRSDSGERLGDRDHRTAVAVPG